MTMTAALAETDALLLRFETEPCPQCKNMTQKRDGASLTCATCGHEILELSRSQYLRVIEKVWPDKDEIIAFAADNTAIISAGWKLPGMRAVCLAIAKMGQKIERSENPNECVEAFFYALNYFARPDSKPGVIELRVIS